MSQIAAQITQAQQQLTQLATQVATLQSSVDHLQSEVQTLFAQGARNDLGTLINQYIGFQQANGTPLPQTQFAQAAGALFQDATSTALTQTLLTVPTGFDALTADSLLPGSDPLTLDTNINLFNFFGAGVSDAPASVGWPGALTTTCPPGRRPRATDLCLPDPDFWATSARAFSQLLLENPSYVTPTRITQLQAIQQEGQLIANALAAAVGRQRRHRLRRHRQQDARRRDQLLPLLGGRQQPSGRNAPQPVAGAQEPGAELPLQPAGRRHIAGARRLAGQPVGQPAAAARRRLTPDAELAAEHPAVRPVRRASTA